MDRVMTWEEIEREYPDKWVLIADPEMGAGTTVLRGTVVFADSDRDVVEGRASVAGLRFSAVMYPGDDSEGPPYLL
jgi:hypothetical protein